MKPKIVYQELAQGSCFALDKKGENFVANTAYLITGEHLQYLIRLLNSSLIEYAYKHFYGTLIGTSGICWLSFNINELPLPYWQNTEKMNRLLSVREDEINKIVYTLYNLTHEEIAFIESQA